MIKVVSYIMIVLSFFGMQLLSEVNASLLEKDTNPDDRHPTSMSTPVPPVSVRNRRPIIRATSEAQGRMARHQAGQVLDEATSILFDLMGQPTTLDSPLPVRRVVIQPVPPENPAPRVIPAVVPPQDPAVAQPLDPERIDIAEPPRVQNEPPRAPLEDPDEDILIVENDDLPQQSATLFQADLMYRLNGRISTAGKSGYVAAKGAPIAPAVIKDPNPAAGKPTGTKGPIALGSKPVSLRSVYAVSQQNLVPASTIQKRTSTLLNPLEQNMPASNYKTISPVVQLLKTPANLTIAKHHELISGNVQFVRRLAPVQDTPAVPRVGKIIQYFLWLMMMI